MNRPHRTAFTLVELLLSVALTAVILTFTAGILASVGQLWVASEKRVENFQNGRAILDLLARELAPAIAPNENGPAWIQFVQNPGDSASGLDGQLASGMTQAANSDSLFWQAPIEQNGASSLSILGYYLTRQTTGNKYQLWRYRVSALVSGTANPLFRLYNAAPSASNSKPSWIFIPKADFQSYSSVISDGVIALWIQCLDANGDPIPWLMQTDASAAPMKFNSAARFQPAIPGSATSFKYTDITTLQANRLPEAVSITIVTVDSRTLDLQSGIPAMPAVTKPEEIPAAIRAFQRQLMDNRIDSARTFATIVRLRK